MAEYTANVLLVPRYCPHNRTAFSALPNTTPTLYETHLWHGRAAPSSSLLVGPALDAAGWQSVGRYGAAGPEQLAPGQDKQLGDPGADPLAAADTTSLSLPLVSSEAGYGLTFQKPQKSDEDCS